ncbi:hypothetical protein J132_01674 [Termitomyces sp. J132]|nr:hypothetical protein J132_01674 [Termitomyces sp. J132]
MSDLASQFEKITMAHAFLNQVDRLLAVARASLAKDPRLAVTAIFQTWLQWFKTLGSGVEWPELATVEKECRQLYEKYKGEEWAPIDPSLEFLMDDLTAGMTVSAPAVASASDPAKHPVGALAVARGEGRSEGCRNKEAANRGDIQEAGPSTPKAAAGGVARGLVTSPKLATTPKSKGKGKGKAKAQDEEDEDIEDHVEESFIDKRLAMLLRCATIAGQITTQKAAGTPRGVKSREMVESDEDDDNNGSDGNMPRALKRAASPSSVASAKRPRTVTSEEGREDMEMRETTPLATVAEVEASDMEIRGEEEVEAVPVATEEEERAEEVEVVRRGTWSDTPLRQMGDDELEWLGKDLRWLMPLTSAASLLDFDERAAGVEQRFRRELEAAREELLAARARYTVARWTLATLVGYRRDCQAFLAWQEENNIGEGDWEETEAMEVPDNDTDLDA